MFAPEGYFSWNDVVREMFEISEKIVSSICAAHAQTGKEGGAKVATHHNTASFYLVKGGFAEDYKEADLIVGITAAYLLVNFIDCFPPVLANTGGAKIYTEAAIFAHRDQLDLCGFSWPPSADPQFRDFFNFARTGHFDTEAILERFAFIDGRTGRIGIKNGSAEFLENYLAMDKDEASKVLSFVREIAGFVVCWPALPEREEVRQFLECVAWDPRVAPAVNETFGHLTTSQDASTKRRPGRPRKRGDAADVYRELFPEGHEANGKAWKDAAREVGGKLKRTVSVSTLKRSLVEQRGDPGQ